MKIIVGLGNPGDKYIKTRHNVGFLFTEYLRSKQADLYSKWKLKNKLEAEISTAKVNKEETILAKPQTFMNESGRSVQKIVSKYKLTNIEDLIVVHDDVDLDFGVYKIQTNRGTAGHNGVSSVVEYMKTKEFKRVRIGIYPEHIDKKHASGPSGQRPGGDTTKFVLHDFSKEDIAFLHSNIFPEIVKKIIEI